jgi:hypothetical protein
MHAGGGTETGTEFDAAILSGGALVALKHRDRVYRVNP